MVDLPDSPAPVRYFVSEHSLGFVDIALNPTKQEHLDLIPLHHLVALELVLNLLIPRLPLLILGTHATTHYGGC